MKLSIRLQHGALSSEYQLEVGSSSPHGEGKVKIQIDGKELQADCVQIAPGTYSVLLDGRSYEARLVPVGPPASAAVSRRVVTLGSRHFTVEIHDPRRRRSRNNLAGQTGPQEMVAPMPGKIVKILMREGQEAVEGAGILVIEAMKMQNELRAPRAGRIAKIYVQEGVGVEAGARLVKLD